MIRFGAVNIDTSHPLGFAEALEKENRARYVGVYNDSFRGDDEVDGFIRRFGLERRCETLEELAGMCDIGLIHGCNWDDHLRCAEPFWALGKPVFLDKPVVGNLRDVERLEALAAKGAVIVGASSARYAYEVQSFLSIPEEERGSIVTVLATGGVDDFNYGVHVAELIGGLLGEGVEWVHYAGRGQMPEGYSDTHLIRFQSGQSAVMTLHTGAWQPFTLTIITTKKTCQLTLDSSRLYAALMHELCNFMEGKPHRLVPVRQLTESVRVMLAAKASREQGGTVWLRDLCTGDDGYDGEAFAAAYGAAAGKIYV